MISCYVIGELHTVESLCVYINDYPLTQLKGYAVQRPESFDAVYSIRPGIVFVDVAFLSGSNSWLERIKQFSSIVLVSENTEMAFEAFEHAAFDYLIRPITFNRFVKSINKFDHLTQLAQSVNISKKQQVVDSFFIKADSKGLKEFLIKCDQLIYIQAMQNYVVLYMENDQRFSCHNSMKEMEDSLPASCFSRIHKSFIINDEKITSIEGNMVILSGDESNKLLIGNTYRKAFFEKKAQKMIRKKSEIQIFSYSRLASALITFGALLLKIQVVGEFNILL
ncbi:two-component system LytT family response regulator [Pedobacter sp. W3I1]|uniref:LytR/AlgR family response regulator transcription factor n=1 Tax=Pedobacter sp. W3I1 TaxID=3042291 RepID=UPI002786FED6|nr:LytTR family DNA-binding domain-containing protein [Pedobacter sp. W3I1]MDQ0638300.1 two-component system LytT family response regulator [Pedobacter sp. W3I1]